MRLAERCGGRTGLAPPGQRLGRAPAHVGLPERRIPRRHGLLGGHPVGGVVLAGGTGELGIAQGHPPPDLVLRDVVLARQACRRVAVSLDHLARRGDGRRCCVPVPRRPRPDRLVGRGLHGREHELADDQRVVHPHDAVESFEGGRDGGGRVTLPQRDLRSRPRTAR